MPTTIERTVFKLSELSEPAKKAARDAYRLQNRHADWWDYVYEDAIECGRLIGINIDTHPVKLHGGGGRDDPSIYFSGFCRQGDGACFSGTYSPTDDAVHAIENYVNADSDLIPIAKELALLQVTARLTDRGSLEGRITLSGHYHHSGTMDCTATYVDVDDEAEQVSEQVEKALTTLMRRFADWIYDQLQSEDEYLNSDECVDEHLADDEFDEDGTMI